MAASAAAKNGLGISETRQVASAAAAKSVAANGGGGGSGHQQREVARKNGKKTGVQAASD